MKIDWEGERSQGLVCLTASGQQEEDSQLLTSCNSQGQGSSKGQLGEPWL